MQSLDNFITIFSASTIIFKKVEQLSSVLNFLLFCCCLTYQNKLEFALMPSIPAVYKPMVY